MTMLELEKDLVELAYKIADRDSPSDARAKLHDEWWSKVQSAPPRTLVSAIAKLSSSGRGPANVKALREAIISEIERKDTEHLVHTMKKLDASAVRLGHYSLVLAVIGIILAAFQVLLGLGLRLPRP